MSIFHQNRTESDGGICNTAGQSFWDSLKIYGSITAANHELIRVDLIQVMPLLRYKVPNTATVGDELGNSNHKTIYFSFNVRKLDRKSSYSKISPPNCGL